MNSLGWLDFGAAEQRQAITLLEQIRERDTVDELGLGSIRDAFAERLFPGTSTIQTRARYFLIVPWIYQALEAKRVGSSEIAKRARNEEIRAIKTLAPLGQRQGVIGIDAQETLKRLPSSIYWYGLHRWGIRKFDGSQRQYHASLDGYYELKAVTARMREDDPAHREIQPNWDPSLPPAPERIESLQLTRDEASYLLERIQIASPTSLLAAMLHQGSASEGVDTPWQHPVCEKLPEALEEDLWHARNFSDLMLVATLFYHYSLAKRVADDGGPEADDAATKRDSLRGRLDDAMASLKEREAELKDWSQDRFWMRLAEGMSLTTTLSTRRFVGEWWSLLLSQSGVLTLDEDKALALISAREHTLKGRLARLFNQEARERWVSQAEPAQMDYRWSATVQRVIRDILEGLDQ